MARDWRKLHVFTLADALVTDVYRVTSSMPASEKYGMQSQLRRAAVSVAVNIVEGSAMRTTREYARYLRIAFGSAAEAGYLTDVSRRLRLLHDAEGTQLSNRYGELQRRLLAMITTLERCSMAPAPRAQRTEGRVLREYVPKPEA